MKRGRLGSKARSWPMEIGRRLRSPGHGFLSDSNQHFCKQASTGPSVFRSVFGIKLAVTLSNLNPLSWDKDGFFHFLGRLGFMLLWISDQILRIILKIFGNF